MIRLIYALPVVVALLTVFYTVFGLYSFATNSPGWPLYLLPVWAMVIVVFSVLVVVLYHVCRGVVSLHDADVL